MKNVTLKASNEQDFFRRGRKLAQLADASLGLPEKRKKRDVDQLAQAELVTIETKTLPGHGHMKE